MLLNDKQVKNLNKTLQIFALINKIFLQKIEPIDKEVGRLKRILSQNSSPDTSPDLYKTMAIAFEDIQDDAPYPDLIKELFISGEDFDIKSYTQEYSEKEMKELAKDFFSSTDRKTKLLFETIYRKNYRHLNIGTYNPGLSYSGFQIYIAYFKSIYINIFRKNNISDANTMVHEYGHAIQSFINFSYKTPNALVEVVSMFFEFASQEYFYSLGVIDSNIASYNRITTLNSRIIDYTKMAEIFNYLSDTGLSIYLLFNPCYTYRIKSELSKIYSEEELESLFIDKPYDMYIYIIGAIIASNLYEIYIQDKKAALSILYHFIKMDQSNHEQIYQFLDSQGLLNPQGYMAYQDMVRKRTL